MFLAYFFYVFFFYSIKFGLCFILYIITRKCLSGQDAFDNYVTVGSGNRIILIDVTV